VLARWETAQHAHRTVATSLQGTVYCTVQRRQRNRAPGSAKQSKTKHGGGKPSLRKRQDFYIEPGQRWTDKASAPPWPLGALRYQSAKVMCVAPPFHGAHDDARAPSTFNVAQYNKQRDPFAPSRARTYVRAR